MKGKLLLLLIMMLIPTALALEECKRIEQPKDIPCRITSTWDYPNACGTYITTLYNETGIIIQNYTMGDFGIYCNVTFNYSTAGSYYYNISAGDSGNILVEPEVKMAGLAVAIFILALTAGVFFLPKLVKRFSENKYLDATLRGLCICIGLFLLSLDTAIIVTIADNAGLGVSRELFRYLWLVNWTAYIAIVIVVLTFTFRIIASWSEEKKKQDMGEDGFQ